MSFIRNAANGIRYAFNGAGAGSGVACSYYGLLFALIGGVVGSSASLVLGVVCLALFSAIGIAMFYFSCTDAANQYEALESDFASKQRNLVRIIRKYIKVCKKVNPQAHAIFTRDLEKVTDTLLYQVIQLSQKIHTEALPLAANVLEGIENPQLAVPARKVYVPAFSGFIGVCGSIAGCGAGIGGLLSGMGVFATFAAIPVLGWSIVVGACLMGGLVGVGVAYYAKQEFRLQAFTHTLDTMRCKLDGVLLEHRLSLHMRETIESLQAIPSDKDTLFATLNQSVSDFMYTAVINKKPALLPRAQNEDELCVEKRFFCC